MARPCPVCLLREEAAGYSSQRGWWQGSLAAAGFGVSTSAMAGGRDVRFIVCRDCVPIPEEEGEDGGLCLKIRQSLGLHVTHSMPFFFQQGCVISPWLFSASQLTLGSRPSGAMAAAEAVLYLSVRWPFGFNLPFSSLSVLLFCFVFVLFFSPPCPPHPFQ